MSTYRHRSRYRVDHRIKSNITFKLASTTSTDKVTPVASDYEDMYDVLTEGWFEKCRTGFFPRYAEGTSGKQTLSSAARLGRNRDYLELRRFLPPVNRLTYTSLSVDEQPDVMIYNTNLPAYPNWCVITGNVIPMLQSQLSGGLPFPAVATPSVLSMDRLVSEAKSKLLYQVNKPEFSFGEPLGEIHSAYRLIKAPFRTVGRLVKSMLRKVQGSKLSGATRRAKYAAAVYAEYNFGISPLLEVVDDVVHATANRLYMKKIHLLQRKSYDMEREGRGFATSTLTRRFLILLHNHNYHLRRSIYLKRHASVGIRYLFTDQESITSLLGLRFRDFPTTLWELAPFSFLIDRVYNVKQFLVASKGFLSGDVKYVGGWETRRETTRVSDDVTDIYVTAAPTSRPRPSRTKPQINTTYSYSRDSWIPQLEDSNPPALAGELLNSLTHTADFASVVLLNLDSFGSYLTSSDKAEPGNARMRLRRR